MVEWEPFIWSTNAIASLADGAAAQVLATPIQDQATAEELDPGAIVNGWFDLLIYTTDAAALSTSRGPVQSFLMLVPKAFTPAVTNLQTASEIKEHDSVAWMMLQAFLEGGATNVLHLRYELRTLRKFFRGDKLMIYLQNNTGAAFPATAVCDGFGEIYVQEE